MKFGLLWPLRNPDPWRCSTADLYRNSLEEIVLAEELGYDTAWLTEHHFVDDDYLPAVMSALGAVAARTSTIRIGTYVLLQGLHNPVRLAEDAAVVDILSGGRLDLGIGVGYRAEEFAGLGIQRKHRGALQGEGVDVMLRAWREGTASFHGEHFDFDELLVTPKPIQRPIPIYLGGVARPILRRVAGLEVAGVAGRPARADMEFFAEECAKAGRDFSAIDYLPMRYIWVAETSQEARRIGLPFAEYVIDTYAKWFGDAGVKAFKGNAEDELIMGSPAEVAEQLHQFIERRPDVPIERLVLQPPLLGLDHKASVDLIELFASEVAPLFKGAGEKASVA